MLSKWIWLITLVCGSVVVADESRDETDVIVDKAEALKLDNVVVVGHRASLSTAQEIKRENSQIVDSVVAEDIGKLPDVSVGEALQRITGVQITRDRGEVGSVTIRGLSQMETTLNGREIFTATAIGSASGRNLDFNDIPAEMIAGIDVYKTAVASQIEGGIGGTIDLRTRKPFDFDDHQAVFSGRMTQGDLVDETEPQFSIFGSNRWQTDQYGELGALLFFSKQTRPWREDQKGSGTPTSRDDLVAGETVIAPSGTSETTSAGDRERTATNFVVQWRPSDAWEFYGEGSYAEFKTIQDSYQLNLGSSSTFVADSVTLFPGSNNVKSITWTDASVSALSFARDMVDRTGQLALGGSWTGDKLDVSADISYSKSTNSLFFSGLVLGGEVAEFSHDLSGSVPDTSVSGTNLLDASNYTFASVPLRTWEFESDLGAVQLDGEYWLDSAFLRSIESGVRIARRRANNSQGVIFADAAVSIPASTMPGFVTNNPYTDFFSGSGSIRQYLVGDISGARDAQTLRDAFGVATPIPDSNPLGTWRIEEETHTAYMMANIDMQHIPLDGNIGVRVVHTDEAVSGNQTVPSGGIAPINVDENYLDILPSINLRYELQPDLFLRAAASKTITRPDFSQLSPSLTLITNTINPELNQGSAGNPELEPIRSTNFDVALERYFNPHTSIYLTAFLKKVDGFIVTESQTETHFGQSYLISRPQNANPADIKGIEIGYQQFYDFLPGWLSGLGLQANYTYVDSETPNDLLGKDVPLQNLSEHSFNIMGMYEKGNWSARLAYNWRDKYLSQVVNVTDIGALPVYTEAYDWLDASIGYRVNDAVAVKLQGTNLLNTVRRSYFSDEQKPQSVWMNDRLISVMVTVRM